MPICPSEKTLQSVFGEELARPLRQALKDAPNVDAALEAASGLLDAFGTEAIRDDGWRRLYCDIGALYVNTGDTYNATIVYDVDADRFLATTFGDFVETAERNGRAFV